MKSTQLEAGRVCVCGKMNWNCVLSSETVSQRKNGGKMSCLEDSPRRLLSRLPLSPLLRETRDRKL